MSNLNLELRQLIADICDERSNHLDRQKNLARLYMLVSKSSKLWRESTPYYQDALQEMWEYCCNHPCEYPSDLQEVTTWLNDELKKRLNKYKMRSQRQNQRHLDAILTKNAETLDPLDLISSPKDIEPVLEMWRKTRDWVETDPDRVLSQTYFRRYPQINARVLILKRIPPDTQDWKTIAAQWDLTAKESQDLPKFYSRNCRPLLIEFGKKQGYI